MYFNKRSDPVEDRVDSEPVRIVSSCGDRDLRITFTNDGCQRNTRLTRQRREVNPDRSGNRTANHYKQTSTSGANCFRGRMLSKIHVPYKSSHDSARPHEQTNVILGQFACTRSRTPRNRGCPRLLHGQWKTPNAYDDQSVSRFNLPPPSALRAMRGSRRGTFPSHDIDLSGQKTFPKFTRTSTDAHVDRAFGTPNQTDTRVHSQTQTAFVLRGGPYPGGRSRGRGRVSNPCNKHIRKPYWGHDDRFLEEEIVSSSVSNVPPVDRKPSQLSGHHPPLQSGGAVNHSEEYFDDFSPEDLEKYKLEVDMNDFIVDCPIISDPILTKPLTKWIADGLYSDFSSELQELAPIRPKRSLNTEVNSNYFEQNVISSHSMVQAKVADLLQTNHSLPNSSSCRDLYTSGKESRSGTQTPIQYRSLPSILNENEDVSYDDRSAHNTQEDDSFIQKTRLSGGREGDIRGDRPLCQSPGPQVKVTGDDKFDRDEGKLSHTAPPLNDPEIKHAGDAHQGLSCTDDNLSSSILFTSEEAQPEHHLLSDNNDSSANDEDVYHHSSPNRGLVGANTNSLGQISQHRLSATDTIKSVLSNQNTTGDEGRKANTYH